MKLPIGYFKFHKNAFINYQLNRWYSLGYTRKEDIEKVGSRTRTFADYIKEFSCLAEEAIAQNRLKNAALGCSQQEEKIFNMALFLVTGVYDEGFSERSFRVVKASSREAVVRQILAHYDTWEYFITSSIFCLWLDDPHVGPKELWEGMNRVIVNAEDRQKLMNVFIPWVCRLSAETFLQWVARTYVDGSSQAQLTIHEIHDIEACDEVPA